MRRHGREGVGWCSGVRPSHTHFFVVVVVVFFCEIDNSKQTDNTDIFQSSSLHKFSDSTVRIWFSLLYPGARVGGYLNFVALVCLHQLWNGSKVI